MRRFLLDTGIAGRYIDRRRGVSSRAREEVALGNKIGIGMPVLAELHYGIEWSASREVNQQLLRRALAALTIWPLTNEAAAEHGRVAAALRRNGRPMQVVDMMVAAIAFSDIREGTTTRPPKYTTIRETRSHPCKIHTALIRLRIRPQFGPAHFGGADRGFAGEEVPFAW